LLNQFKQLYLGDIESEHLKKHIFELYMWILTAPYAYLAAACDLGELHTDLSHVGQRITWGTHITLTADNLIFPQTQDTMYKGYK